MSQFTQEQLDYFYGFPKWAVSGWAFAVWGSVVGTIFLLLRRRWAVWAFGVSLFGLSVTTLYNFVLTNGAEVMGAGGSVFTIVIWVVAIFLYAYSRNLVRTGVLT